MTDEIERESISESELVARWGMNNVTFFFRKQNRQVPKCFVRNMTSHYLLTDVEEFEAKNRIVVASSTDSQ